jgi:CxxC motif-containing protein (DUF1111 family)
VSIGWQLRAALGACAIAYLSTFVVASEIKVPASLADLASTTPRFTAESFGLPSADLRSDEIARFLRGENLFNSDLVRRLAQEKGIEPRPRNANSCSDCHSGGGRNGVKQEGERAFPFAPMVVFRPTTMTSLPPNGRSGRDAAPSPQLVKIRWQPTQVLIDGQEYSLIYPLVTIDDTVAESAHIRVTPPLSGLGLLQEVSDADMLDWYRNHKIGRLPPRLDSQDTRFGRFGLKSTSVSILDFAKTALHDELGIVDENDLSGAQIADLAFYASQLGVPKRQAEDQRIDAGYAVFVRLGCSDCHRPSYEVHRPYARDRVTMAIWPFSDLLLHDLAYADQPAEGGREFWRTTPLWGLGRVEATLGHGAYLHDGRARTLEEAILWHGGEAAPSRYLFLESTSDAQSALLAFLRSL